MSFRRSVPGVPLPENAVENAVAKLDGIADELMKKSGIPGMAVAVVHGGKTIYAKGFGVRDIRSGDAGNNRVDPDTVFQLASVSKSISSTVVAHQVSENAIGWDTPDRVEAAMVRAVRPCCHPDGQRR